MKVSEGQFFAVVEVPGFRLRAVERLRESPIRGGAVLVEARGRRSRVVACDPVAARAGVVVGMTAAAALAKRGDLTLLGPDGGAEEAAGRLVFAAAGRLSPVVEETAPGLVTVDLRGRSEESLPGELLRTVETLGTAGLPTRVGVGRTPFFARVAALRADPVCWVGLVGEAAGEIGCAEVDFLEATPILDALVGWDEGLDRKRFEDVMGGWGIGTLGAFGRLERSSVAARLGEAGARLQDQVRGRAGRLLRVDAPPKVFATGLELESPVECLEPLLFILKRLLETLSAELAAAVLAAGAVRVELGQARGKPWVARLELPEPTHRVEPIFAILESRLEGVRTETEIVRVGLLLEPAERVEGQRNLFVAGLEDPHRFADTLARLRGILGEGGYGSPQREDRHDPGAFVMEEPGAWEEEGSLPGLDRLAPVEVWRRTARTAEVVPAGEDCGPVLRRYRPPRPVVVRCRPDGVPTRIVEGRPGGEIVGCRGPWVSAGGWWDANGWNRLEWDIELARGGGLYRLVLEGEGRWVVEGMYD